MRKMETVSAPTSILERIQRKEAEFRRRLALAQGAAQERIAQAEREAHALRTEEEARGRQEAEEGRRRVLAAAEKEAAAIVSQARAQAQALRSAGEKSMDAAVCRAVHFVLWGSHETPDGPLADRRA